MIQVLENARAENMLVSEHVGERVDGAARDAGGPDLLRPLGRRPLAELFLELLDQSLPVGHSVGVGRVALVLGQLGTAHYLAQVGELGVVADGHYKGLVGGVEGLVGDAGRVGVADQTGVLAAYKILLTAVGEPAQGGLEEGDFDARALSGDTPLMQGGQDRVRREKAAYYVRDRDSHLRGFAVGLARDAHDATPGLHQEVVARSVLIRPWAEARDGAVDEARVRFLERLVTETELLQGPAPPVFDQDVGPGRELLDPLQPRRVFEVNPDRTLVPVDGEKIRRLAIFLAADEGRSPVTGVVPALGVLDLYDVGPEVTEHHRRVRPGQNPREVEDPDAFKGEFRVVFHAASVAPSSTLRPAGFACQHLS